MFNLAPFSRSQRATLNPARPDLARLQPHSAASQRLCQHPSKRKSCCLIIKRVQCIQKLGLFFFAVFTPLKTACFMFQVSLVLSALQAGNKGTQACITAAGAVSGIIADLDTTIMFASAGTLNPENEESFADHRYSDLEAKKRCKMKNLYLLKRRDI